VSDTRDQRPSSKKKAKKLPKRLLTDTDTIYTPGQRLEIILTPYSGCRIKLPPAMIPDSCKEIPKFWQGVAWYLARTTPRPSHARIE
jgi:hypothetical protein